ncbi:AMP-binding protein [Cnuibacter physcomitrellae]|uniref:AMP-binding protein n=1 Tax=Cnuibacter physcomitrellae TaxID=1619308 RepID=UPI002175E433|nr:AMP-binding protein [Cnuibacter physcomitrellae]MCS5497697.1 AMP-binding protein [Cnuibacter physcomitrellae]
MTERGSAATIASLVARAVDEDPGRVCVIDGDIRLTLTELMSVADRIRDALAAAGTAPGDIVSMQLPNAWTTVAAMVGTWSVGAVVNPITTIYRCSELATIFDAARPRVVLVSTAGRSGQEDVAAGALRVAGVGSTVLDIDRVLSGAPPADAVRADVGGGAATDVALLMFTSGTTGRPKGVLHSHETLLYEAQSIADVFGLDRTTVFMPSPLAHVTGLLYGVLLPLLVRGSVSLLDRWDPETAVDLIERDRCGFTVSATPFLRGLTDCYGRRGTTSALEHFVCGGADIPPALVAEAEQVTGIRVARTYGSTEMPTLCVVRPDDADGRRLTSEGYPIGEARARLSDDGELEVTGPELFLGYLDPRDDADAFTPDGWFRTGDLAAIAADGRISLTGRKKDLIVRGGENISAKEVEDLLLLLPTVADVAVVGVPDPLMGERACAVVVPAGAGAVTLAEVTAHLDAQGIARQKFPELLWLVDALPRTVSGKVQKFVLRKDATAAVAEGGVERRR